MFVYIYIAKGKKGETNSSLGLWFSLILSCIQTWKNVLKTIRHTLAERLRTPDKKHGDLLDLIVQQLHCEEPLINEDFAVDMVSTLLFASIYTLAAIIAITFKSLHDNPVVVHALKVCSMRLYIPLFVILHRN
jgi:cytochrome P450